MTSFKTGSDGRRGKDVALVWAKPTEAAFMAQVTQLATLRGWLWVHVRPGMTRDSWRTPISGPLGKGMADLMLFQPVKHRILFAELKRDAAAKRATPPEQVTFLGLAGEAGAEAFLWEPGDWDEIERVLR